MCVLGCVYMDANVCTRRVHSFKYIQKKEKKSAEAKGFYSNDYILVDT